MKITKKYAKRLIGQGKAQEETLTTDQPKWEWRHQGNVYVAITRLDLQRIDHYLDNSRS